MQLVEASIYYWSQKMSVKAKNPKCILALLNYTAGTLSEPNSIYMI